MELWRLRFEENISWPKIAGCIPDRRVSELKSRYRTLLKNYVPEVPKLTIQAVEEEWYCRPDDEDFNDPMWDF
jgi:hypothetical protein